MKKTTKFFKTNLKKVFLLLLFLTFNNTYAQYLENFNIADRGIIQGLCPDDCSKTKTNYSGVDWTISGVFSDFYSGDFVKTVAGDKLEFEDTDGEVFWESPTLDISDVPGTVSIIADVEWVNHDGPDYMKLEYSVDGGAWVIVSRQFGGNGNANDYTVNYSSSDQSARANLQSGNIAPGASTLNVRICSRFTVSSDKTFIHGVSVPETGVKAPEFQYTWNGSESDDWNAPANWSAGLIPAASTEVTIPNNLNRYPVAQNAVDVKSITMASGATMIAKNTVSGDFTYNLSIPTTNWHLISSPALGEGYDTAWITDNSIATSGPNIGISTYDNGTPSNFTFHWRYTQTGQTGNFNQGEGYGLLRESAGAYSFVGTFPTENISKNIKQDYNSWNLTGNPYPSYLSVQDVLTDNANQISLSYQALYIWDAAAGQYSGRTTGTMHPGQGFFIRASQGSGQMNYYEFHQRNDPNTGTFYKEDAATITLKISDETNYRETLINYIDGKTKGLDPGFDFGMFDGASSNLSLYTRLVEDYEETAFERQALPNSDFETMIIPIGLNATANKEITFSAEALNLPAGLKVFLEDRETNTFARLDETNGVYSVTLSEALNGPGRFYLHTSKSALSTGNVSLENVSIYKLDNATLRINGVQNSKTNVTLFTVLGKQVLNTAFQSNGVSDISLPKLAAGVYIVQLKNDNGTFQKKIILE